MTRGQLLELGLARRTISRMVERGQLLRVHAGVYAVGHPRPEPRARAVAAVLTLGRRDVRRQHGVRVTSPARTLNDIAPRLTRAELARAVNDARLKAGLRLSQLEGTPLRTLTDAAPTRSVFEDAFLAFARRFGLPTPQINARVAGYEVDVLFEDQKLILELDGYRYHRDLESFERDRERDATTLAAGYEAIRLTWRRLVQNPKREAARLLLILAQRGYPSPSYRTLPSL